MFIPIPIDAQIRCVDRELAMRRRVYPGLVHTGRLTQSKMDNELACMEAVRATLELHLPQAMLFPTELDALRAEVQRLQARYEAMAAHPMPQPIEEP